MNRKLLMGTAGKADEALLAALDVVRSVVDAGGDQRLVIYAVMSAEASLDVLGNLREAAFGRKTKADINALYENANTGLAVTFTVLEAKGYLHPDLKTFPRG